MYTIKAHVMNYATKDAVRVATATIKTHDIGAFMAMRDQPIGNVPPHLDVNVDTYVDVMGHSFRADANSLAGLCEALLQVQQELHVAERDTVHFRKRKGNGYDHDAVTAE